MFSDTFEDHINHLQKLLNAILAEGFRLKLSKCRFAANSVKYLGHIIENNTISPLKDNLISIKEFPIPNTQKQVRQFLGKINFYNKYIEKSSILLDPLHNLLRKGEKFVWSKECNESFESVKLLLCSKPVLSIFDKNLPIYVYTDASIKGIGAILKQQQENGEIKPVAYFSKNQKKKKAINLECLAIKEAIKYWQYRFLGTKFKVFCDHKPLERMNIRSRTDEELGDLTHYLSQYDFDIKYSPGKQNLEADCLSRNPVLEPHNEDEQLRVVNFISLNEILKDQNANKKLEEKKDKFILKKNIYYKKVRKKEKIILSEEFSIEFIKKVHKHYCHIGIKQTQNKIS